MNYTDWWNQQILDACRRAWNKPDLTLEELRTKQTAKSDVQFDRERDLDERGLVARDAYSQEHPLQSSGAARII